MVNVDDVDLSLSQPMTQKLDPQSVAVATAAAAVAGPTWHW